MSEQIDQSLKEERLARLLKRVGSQTERHLKAMIGKRVTLILENETDGGTQYHFKGRLTAPRKRRTLVDAIVTGKSTTALQCRALQSSLQRPELTH